ncbi:MAG: hypothetical protein WBH44_04865 [Proteocatella sp.]
MIQKEESDFIQEEINAILKTLDFSSRQNRTIFKTKAVGESGMGAYEYKIAQNLGKSKAAYDRIKNQGSSQK